MRHLDEDSTERRAAEKRIAFSEIFYVTARQCYLVIIQQFDESQGMCAASQMMSACPYKVETDECPFFATGIGEVIR